jgi:hypothetical protein
VYGELAEHTTALSATCNTLPCPHGLELQVYPVLLSNEAKELEDAAVKLISDFSEHKPPEPTDPDDTDLLHRYRRDMAIAAESVCELFKMLCAKRPSLLQRFFNIYLENGQDPDIKVQP